MGQPAKAETCQRFSTTSTAAVTYQQIPSERVDFAEADVRCIVDERAVVKLMNEPVVAVVYVTRSADNQTQWLRAASLVSMQRLAHVVNE